MSIMNVFNCVMRSVKKYITIGLFFILPRKLTETFLRISVVLVLKETNKQDERGIMNVDRFRNFLTVNYEEDVVALPNYTLDWFWGDDFLDKTLVVRGRELKICDALSDGEIIRQNIGLISDSLISELPLLLRIKLGMFHGKNRSYFRVKKEVMETINDLAFLRPI